MSETFTVDADDGHVVHGSYMRAEPERGAALLVHGITADRHEWGFFDALSSELCMRGVSTAAIDYRGHGQSAVPIESISLSGVFLDIQAGWRFVDKTANPDPSSRRILVGNSFGGGLSLLFGSLERRIDLVVATCPVLSYVADILRVNPRWQEELPSGMVRYASKQLPASVISEMYAYDMVIRGIHDTNLVIFHGTADSDVPYSESVEFVRRHRDGVLHAIEGMDHSFSAPEGSTDRDDLSAKYRARAGRLIAEHITHGRHA
jgi:pimeloyl-ACP methyl ester carboxylesterase